MVKCHGVLKPIVASMIYSLFALDGRDVEYTDMVNRFSQAEGVAHGFYQIEGVSHNVTLDSK